VQHNLLEADRRKLPRLAEVRGPDGERAAVRLRRWAGGALPLEGAWQERMTVSPHGRGGAAGIAPP
jgi:hypothetical protein